MTPARAATKETSQQEDYSHFTKTQSAGKKLTLHYVSFKVQLKLYHSFIKTFLLSVIATIVEVAKNSGDLQRVEG